MKKFLLILFITTAVAEILSQAISINTIHIVSKPMLMIVLAGYYLQAVKNRSKTVLSALFFSWVGDVLLMLQHKNNNYFMFGLAAFLIAHLFFIFSYNQHRSRDSSNALLGVQRFRLSLPIVLAGTGLITILYNHLGSLKIPVMVYAFVLVIMVLCSLFRFGRTTSISFVFVFIGALLFMLSDSLIAVNKFLVPIEHSGLWIMMTYIPAQYLIIEGLIRHK